MDKNDVYWCNRIQKLIVKYTVPITKGKYRGHGITNTEKWISDLHKEIISEIRKRNKGRAYDENMAIAAIMGRALTVWYCAVHRAKSFDPNRPLARKKANQKVEKYRGELMAAISSDELMGVVFAGQLWNFPFGRGAFGGEFI